MTVLPKRRTKLDRYFGKCPVRGCGFRRVHDGAPYIIRQSALAAPGGSVIYEAGVATPIFYGGHDGQALVDAGLFCADHGMHLSWTQLQGRVNPDKECNGVCMGAVGPSCDCSCGGENHGKNHV